MPWVLNLPQNLSAEKWTQDGGEYSLREKLHSGWQLTVHVADGSGIETIQSVSGLLLGNSAMAAHSVWGGEVASSSLVSPLRYILPD